MRPRQDPPRSRRWDDLQTTSQATIPPLDGEAAAISRTERSAAPLPSSSKAASARATRDPPEFPRRQKLSEVAGDDDESVAHWDLTDASPECGRQSIRAAKRSGVVAMDTGRPGKRHRPKTRAEQVDALDQLGAQVAEQMLLDATRTVPCIEGDAIRHEPPIDERLDPVLDQLEADGVGEPVGEAAGRCGPAVVLLGPGRDHCAEANVRIKAGGEPFEIANGESLHE
jgi:hypothetical protein